LLTEVVDEPGGRPAWWAQPATNTDAEASTAKVRENDIGPCFHGAIRASGPGERRGFLLRVFFFDRGGTPGLVPAGLGGKIKEPAKTGFTVAAATSIAVGLSIGVATTVGVTLAVADHGVAAVRGRPAPLNPLGPHQVQYGDRCFHGHCLP
jgi:hypothetical protein